MSTSGLSCLVELILVEGILHEVLEDEIPLLGDSTSTQGLLFSPAFEPYTLPESTYPNYTLPSINSTYPPPPSSSPNYTLALFPTSSVPSSFTLSRSACAIREVDASQNIGQGQRNQSVISRGPEGFRNQWIVGGLNPSTNYTAYVVKDGGRLSQTAFFTSKTGIHFPD